MTAGRDKEDGPSKRPPAEADKKKTTEEEGVSATQPKGSHWVEAKYRRDDFTTFTARSYVPKAESCPQAAKDNAGNSGSLVEGTCIEVNQGCFIATAAFGSELHPQVQLLRQFRDEHLLKSNLRLAFERVLVVYYRFSPPVAAAMGRSREVKALLKVTAVYPAIIFVKGWVAFLRATHREFDPHRDELSTKNP